MRLVVDGAVDLPTDLARAPHVGVANQEIWVDGAPFGGDSDRFWSRLRAGERFSTTPPTVTALAEAYAAGAGRSVCAVHVSKDLSATVRHAREAATRVPGPVLIVDSKSLSVGAGLVAFLAEQLFSEEGDWTRLATSVPRIPERVHTFVVVQDHEPLRRSERIKLLPTTRLNHHHPVLLAVHGRALALAQPRDRSAALQQLVVHARRSAAGAVAGWAVGHGDAADSPQVTEHLTAALGSPPLFCCTIDPIVGVHVGADAIVVAVY